MYIPINARVIKNNNLKNTIIGILHSKHISIYLKLIELFQYNFIDIECYNINTNFKKAYKNYTDLMS